MPGMRGARGLAAGGVALALAAGATAALAVRDDDGPRRPSATRAAPAGSAPAAAPPAETSPPPHVIGVRRAGGVADGWASRLAAIDGVGTVARVRRAQAMLRSTRTAAGRTRRVRGGYAVALDTFVVPRAYARLLPAPVRPVVRRLRAGTAILSRTSARVRGAGVGSTLTLRGGRRLRIVGVLDDGFVRAAELVVGPAEGGRLGASSPSLMAVVTSDAAIRRARRTFSGARSRVTYVGRGPWRVGRRIVPPVILKERFGEFALRLPVGRDWVRPDPAWVRRNIVARRVPMLGRVTCHRRMFAPLRRALTRLARRGLARLVDRGDYAGCYAPRRIPSSGTLSLHAWGLAVDVNASRNPQGSPPDQDPRLVRALERAGLWWGGRWPTVPDGMHFEYHGPDDPPDR